MIPIFTFTANLLAETTYSIPEWNPGKTSRALEESFQVGGKGINVSKMLLRLGGETTALCFPGSYAGNACRDWLKDNEIPYQGFAHGCITRAGSVVRSDNHDETTFLGIDSTVSKAAVEQAMQFLHSQEDPFVFAICGSIQAWDASCWNPLRAWLENRSENAMLAVDTYGPPLDWIARQSPDCIKINRDELLQLADRKDAPTSDLIEEVHERMPCPLWIITDGSRAVWVKHGNSKPVSHKPPKVDSISPTGCGDVFFATLLNGLYQEEELALSKLLHRCMEYASRNAASPGIADFEL